MTEPDLPDPLLELAAAVRELSLAVKGKRGPTRHDARALLLPLGELLLGGREEQAAQALQGLEQTLEPVGEAWVLAIQEELSLACSEHVHSVDPRYLSHPRYDFDYTLAARERLEQRLAAAQVLGVPAGEELLAGVAQADERLKAAISAADDS